MGAQRNLDLKTIPVVTTTPLKRCAQIFLKQIGLYQRAKSSRLYDWYWSFVNRQCLIERAHEMEFYRKTLEGFQKGNLIFDVGANDGWKTDVFLRLGAKVVAIEPDQTNVKILEEKFLRNRFFPKAVKIEEKAASDTSGATTMWIDAPGSALNTLNFKWASALRNDDSRFGRCFDFDSEKIVQTVTLEKLIQRYGVPFYIKIDVEGHELNVLRGLNCSVPYLSFEANLPEFMEEGLECIRTLADVNAAGEFNYATNYQNGMALDQWISAASFTRTFEQCKKSAVEIFWRTPVTVQQSNPQ